MRNEHREGGSSYSFYYFYYCRDTYTRILIQKYFSTVTTPHFIPYIARTLYLMGQGHLHFILAGLLLLYTCKYTFQNTSYRACEVASQGHLPYGARTPTLVSLQGHELPSLRGSELFLQVYFYSIPASYSKRDYPTCQLVL